MQPAPAAKKEDRTENKKAGKKPFVQKLQERFRFTSLFKPLVYLILFSLIYDIGYVWAADQGFAMAALSVAWKALYGLGLYFVCTLAWGRKRGALSGRITLYVLIWSVLPAAFVWMMDTALLDWYGNPAGMLLLYGLSAMLLIFLIPYTLLLWHGLYMGETSLKRLFESAWDKLKANYTKIINFWLILFLVRVVWDSMFAGPLGMNESFNLVLLLSNLVYLGWPMMYPVMLIMLSKNGIGGGIGELILLYVLWDLLLCWLALNAVCWLGELAGPAKPAKKMGRKTRLERMG